MLGLVGFFLFLAQGFVAVVSFSKVNTQETPKTKIQSIFFLSIFLLEAIKIEGRKICKTKN